MKQKSFYYSIDVEIIKFKSKASLQFPDTFNGEWQSSFQRKALLHLHNQSNYESIWVAFLLDLREEEKSSWFHRWQSFVLCLVYSIKRKEKSFSLLKGICSLVPLFLQ